MGQKIHPLGFRIDVTQKYRSQWFVKPNQYPKIVMEDHFIREYFFKRYPFARISTITIKRAVRINRIEIKLITPEFFLFFEKKKIKKELISKLKIFRAENYPLAISSNNFKKIEKQKKPENDQSILISLDMETSYQKYRLASFFADFLVLQFEKRVLFRKALRQVMRSYRRAHLHNVEGIKIQISGRLNGAEIARTEWARKGRVPLHTLQADIDYSSKSAKTIYGLLGIKIWVFRGITKTKMRTPFPNKIPKKALTLETAYEKNRLASFFADLLVLQFEKGVLFRKALRQVMRDYRQPHLHNVEGIKIQISGRLNGAEIARTEWARKGRVPLHTLQADIDYSSQSAKTIKGLLDIKIWVFRGITKTEMQTPFPNQIPKKILNLPVKKTLNLPVIEKN